MCKKIDTGKIYLDETFLISICTKNVFKLRISLIAPSNMCVLGTIPILRHQIIGLFGPHPPTLSA